MLTPQVFPLTKLAAEGLWFNIEEIVTVEPAEVVDFE